jgi:hypothetical protein
MCNCALSLILFMCVRCKTVKSAICLTNFFEFSSHFLLGQRTSRVCITPIIHIEITTILKVLWKIVQCVTIVSIKVHLSAVGIVLCIEIKGCVGTMRS